MFVSQSNVLSQCYLFINIFLKSYKNVKLYVVSVLSLAWNSITLLLFMGAGNITERKVKITHKHDICENSGKKMRKTGGYKFCHFVKIIISLYMCNWYLKVICKLSPLTTTAHLALLKHNSQSGYILLTTNIHSTAWRVKRQLKQLFFKIIKWQDFMLMDHLLFISVSLRTSLE